MRKESIKHIAAVSAFLAFILLFSMTCLADTPEEDALTFEIKLLLDSERTIGEDHLLSERIREQFKTEQDYATFRVMYLETPDGAYLNEGWINRIRVKEGKNGFKITYKKRYSVQGEDIEAAVSDAAADNFTLSDPTFDAEIDWGYSKMTLSFSCDVGITTEEPPDLKTLERNNAMEMVEENMPPREKDWLRSGWGSEVMKSVQVAGPVQFDRYSGELNESEIRVEVWQIPVGDEIQDIVELSVKCDNLEDARQIRETLIDTLDRMNILIHSDSLKTQMVMDGLFHN
ncbi:MAG: hypothetical protein IJ088_01485 [Clostridia bacterium]|nr:hypothetical protein [Clostridia bacterium]